MGAVAYYFYGLANLRISVELRTVLLFAARMSDRTVGVSVFSSRDWLRAVAAPVALSVACDEIRDLENYHINAMRLGLGWAKNVPSER